MLSLLKYSIFRLRESTKKAQLMDSKVSKCLKFGTGKLVKIELILNLNLQYLIIPVL